MTTETPPPPTPADPAPAQPQATGLAPRTALVLLVAVVIAAGACLLTLALTPSSAHLAVAWAGCLVGVVFCAGATLVAHARFTNDGLRRMVATNRAENLALQSELAARQAADRSFADRVVPVVVEKLRGGSPAESALSAAPRVENEAQRRALRTLASEVHRGEALRASAIAAAANAAGRMQALATGMAADLREMEHRHADEEVLGDLLHLDHRNAQAGRLADCVAVLTGARSGRRWAKPIVMESVLRGAMGRIGGYQRIRLHSGSDIAVAGHAAEGVMHVLAELMDNAANFSPPTSEVHVYVEEVAAGAVVTVEDGGLVMGEVALRRAEKAVQGAAQDLAGLSGTRLGLAVVGRLARKHGLTVAFRPSAHGGTGVLVRIPRELLTTPPESGSDARGGDTFGRGLSTASLQERAATRTPSEEAADAPAARPEHTPTPAHGTSVDGDTAREHVSEATPSGDSGLPKRRRGETLAQAQGGPRRRREANTQAPPVRSAKEAGTRLGAFRQAVQRAESEHAEESTDGTDSTTAGTPAHPTAGPLPQEEPGPRERGRASASEQETAVLPAQRATALPEQETAVLPVQEASTPPEQEATAQLPPQSDAAPTSSRTASDRTDGAAGATADSSATAPIHSSPRPEDDSE